VALEMNTDVGAATVWLDGLRAININSERYDTINRRLWSLNSEDGEIEFETGQRSRYNPGDTVIRITGVVAPRALSADTDVVQIDPEYVIPKAMEIGYRHMADRRGDRPDNYQALADTQMAIAERRLIKMGRSYRDVRWVD